MAELIENYRTPLKESLNNHCQKPLKHIGNIHDSYKEKMEDLKISRKNEMKSLKNDFASRRDLLFKKYPPKKRKKKQLDINDTKPNKVKSDKKTKNEPVELETLIGPPTATPRGAGP